MLMLEIENLTFRYKGQAAPVFDNFSMTLPPGRIYGLLGRNGTGKSTLLYLMSGLLTPQKGRATLNGTDVRLRLPLTMREIFLVPDEFELPDVTLSEYVGSNAIFYPKFNSDDMQMYLKTFGMSGEYRLSALSLGQRKKIFMSFAMATHTRVLLMDEPTNGLDIPGKEQFREFLTAGHTPDNIFVVSTHQVKDIELVIDHITVIDRNRVVADVDADEASRDGNKDLEGFFKSIDF